MKVGLLNQTHPSYDGSAVARRRALYEGGRRWQELVPWWLPKHPEEADETYEHRKKRALYENHAGPLVAMLAAAVFSEAPTVDLDGAASWLPAFLANVDGAGTALGPWFGERLVDALVQQCAFVWVNLPARPEGVTLDTLGDEEQAGVLNAFLVGLDAEQVIDWAQDAHGRLLWVVVRDVLEERASVEAGRTRTHRWTYIDASTVRRWVWVGTAERPDPTDEDDALEQPQIPHGFGELPVVRLELPSSLHAMGKLHDPAIAHLRSRNDLSWALHRAAHALLVIKAKWDDKRPVLGPGYYLSIGQDDDAMYVEPSGGNFELLRQDTTDLREELYRLVQQMAVGADSDAARSKMSGVSKAEDWHAMDVVVGALAGLVRDLIGEVVRLVGKVRSVTADPAIGGLDGWAQEDLEPWLAAAAAAVDAHQMSPTFRRAIAKRQARRLLQDEDPEVLTTIETEIDEAEIDPAPYVLPPAPAPTPTPEPTPDPPEP